MLGVVMVALLGAGQTVERQCQARAEDACVAQAGCVWWEQQCVTVREAEELEQRAARVREVQGRPERLRRERAEDAPPPARRAPPEEFGATRGYSGGGLSSDDALDLEQRGILLMSAGTTLAVAGGLGTAFGAAWLALSVVGGLLAVAAGVLLFWSLGVYALTPIAVGAGSIAGVGVFVGIYVAMLVGGFVLINRGMAMHRAGRRGE